MAGVGVCRLFAVIKGGHTTWKKRLESTDVYSKSCPHHFAFNLNNKFKQLDILRREVRMRSILLSVYCICCSCLTTFKSSPCAESILVIKPEDNWNVSLWQDCFFLYMDAGTKPIFSLPTFYIYSVLFWWVFQCLTGAIQWN